MMVEVSTEGGALTSAQARSAGRVQNIMAAKAKFAARLQESPDHPKAALWNEKLVEYDEALREQQLELELADIRAKRQGGVAIGVPTKDFKKKT